MPMGEPLWLRRLLIDPHEAIVLQASLHPLIDLRGFFPGIKGRPVEGGDLIDLSWQGVLTGPQHWVASVLHKFTAQEHAV